MMNQVSVPIALCVMQRGRLSLPHSDVPIKSSRLPGGQTTIG